jgi:ribosomal protein S18 acetylase RimI-like enzyme
MVNIIYRHYKPGDEKGLADLFNIAFPGELGGYVRTPKSWLWRYAQSPNFEPEMCQIAEDSDNKLIVGVIYVNLVEDITIGGKNYLTGELNELATHPEYAHKGIANNLIDMAEEYMKKKGCALSIFNTDEKGIAREKLFLKRGYYDLEKYYGFLNVANPLKLVRDLPIFAGFLPIFLFNSYIPRVINRIRIRRNIFFNAIHSTIEHNRGHVEYMEAANRIIPMYYDGFPQYNKGKVFWARVRVPSKRHEPTYIKLKKNNQIIGGATFTFFNIYSFKYGVKIRVGLIHEIFLDEIQFKNQRDLHLGYIYLIDRIMKAATRRFIGVLLYQSDSKNKRLHKALTRMNFPKFPGEVIMLKIMKDNIKILNVTKPFYLPTYVSRGFP